MTRRVFLVGVMVLYKRGSIAQLIVGLIYCLVHLTVQLQAQPYIELTDDCAPQARPRAPSTPRLAPP